MLGSVSDRMLADRTRADDGRIPSALPVGLVARLALVASAVVVMGGVVYIVWTGVEVYAQHLCKWPATISCEDGPDVWWLVPSGLGVIAAATTWGLVNWARAGTHRISWLIVAWLVGFAPLVVKMRPRQFGPADLTVEVLYVAVGVGFVAAVAIESAPAKKRLVIGSALIALVGVGVVALLLPDILSASWSNRL